MSEFESHRTIERRARRVWRALTSPDARIGDPQERVRVQVLATLLGAGLPLFVVLTAASAATREEPLGIFEGILFVGIGLALIVGYLLSRTRATRAAAWIVTLLGTLGPSAAALTETDPPRVVSSLMFSVGGVAYAAYFLPRWQGRVVALVTNLAVLATVLWHPAVDSRPLAHTPMVIAIFTVFVLIGQHFLVEGNQTIRRQARQLRDIIENTPIGMAVLDGTRLVFANSALIEVLQVPRSQSLIGEDLLNFLHEEDRDQLDDPPLGERMTLRIRRRDDTYRLFEASLIPQQDIDGFGTRLLVANDVTEQHDIRQRLILTERLASLGTIAASVGHEINNPLTFVLINLDFLHDELPGLLASTPHRDRVSELLRVLGDTRDGAKRASDIVTELKAFARGDEDEPGEVDVEAVLRSSLRVASTEIRHRARVLENWGPMPRVNGSAARLGQVFLNLLVNAAQAIAPGAADQNEVRIRTFTAEGGEAAIEIEDTGPGIPDELRSRIFEPFFTTKPMGQGTGLGLAICVKIVRDLSGRIEVQSAVGKGTTFRVFLPGTTARSEAVSSSHAVVLEPPLGQHRVLVVEDDRQVAEAVKRLLRGYEVVLAKNGEEALELCLATPFDAIVCDLIMPRKAGWELFEELESQAADQAQRLVFVTAGATRPQAQSFLARVDNPVLEKPFDAAELKRVVRALCSKS